MSYLQDFQKHIKKFDYPGFLKLWEEYCYSDIPDVEELKQILNETKNSDLAQSFGNHVQRAILLWEKIENEQDKYDILKLIVDIQNKNDMDLAEIAYNALQDKFSNDPLFNEKIRLVGLRSRDNFQGAISRYELLSHINKGKFVFHTSGWGTGEIIDFSLIREEMTLEFEYVIGHKSLSFDNALKTLIPLSDNHFLSCRFGNPDLLEKKAKDNPLEIIHLLLKDLGPKSAAEIKDNLCELVIPAEDWNRWWQTARSKIKKDTKIESPKTTTGLFKLRKEEVSHEEQLHKELDKKPDPNEIIQMVYSYMKNFPDTLKNQEFANSLQIKLNDILSYDELDPAKRFQIYFFLQDLKAENATDKIKEFIEKNEIIDPIVNDISIIGLKKKALMALRKYKKDWEKIFLDIFLTLDQNILREYLFTELLKNKKEELEEKLQLLLKQPLSYPQCFIWYFQKIITDKKNLPYSDSSGKKLFFEGFMILLDHLNKSPEFRDLVKKMISILTSNRYELVREIFEMTTINEAKEYILLATKCSVLSDHEIKIIHSLAKIIHPSLQTSKYEEASNEGGDIIWITPKGYDALKEKILHVSSVDIIDNAKEIEEARSHGDLRENAEYKAALERRSRLQNELKNLSDQFNKAKILYKENITTNKIDIGTTFECNAPNVKNEEYTILGPFEANPEKNILSYQSKLAQEVIGKSVGEKFAFQDKEFTITKIRNALE